MLVVARARPAAMLSANSIGLASAVLSAGPMFTNFAAEGEKFFNSMRVPAALVAGAAVKDAFVMQAAPEDIKRSRAWTMLRNTYLLLMLWSFSSQVCVVFVSTHAIVKLQMTGLNTLASSLHAMLLRELEYEYVGARCGFMTGLLAFLVAQALRTRLALRRTPDLSWCATSFLVASAFSLLS